MKKTEDRKSKPSRKQPELLTVTALELVVGGGKDFEGSSRPANISWGGGVGDA